MIYSAIKKTLKIFIGYYVIAVPIATIIEVLKWSDRTNDFGSMISRAFWGSVYWFAAYGLIALPIVFVVILALSFFSSKK